MILTPDVHAAFVRISLEMVCYQEFRLDLATFDISVVSNTSPTSPFTKSSEKHPLRQRALQEVTLEGDIWNPRSVQDKLFLRQSAPKKKKEKILNQL